jgi:hypothetical protein
MVLQSALNGSNSNFEYTSPAFAEFQALEMELDSIISSGDH